MTDAVEAGAKHFEPPRLDVIGVGISAINPTEAVGLIDRWIERGERRYICVANVHSVMEAHRRPALRNVMNASGLTTPDGMPLVWLLRSAGYTETSRVYGPDLLLEMCRRSATMNQRHFFLGGAEGVAEAMVTRLLAQYPGLQVAGTFVPPFRALSEEEDTLMIETVNRASPDVVWVGLGAPKQELWMAEHRARLDAPVLVGVGAAFDFHAGTVKQAPRRLQAMGLEWAYRLLREPKRLWRRYLIYNPWFIALVAAQRLKGERIGNRSTPSS